MARATPSRQRGASRSRADARPFGRFDIASVGVLTAFAAGYATIALLRGVPAWIGWLYAGASVLCFVLYAVDKAAAIDGRERIPESTLLAIGTLGGWPGAVVAQQALRHKTRKLSFRVRFWVSVAVNVAVFAWVTTQMVRGRH
jgi:uncharacterized membrane protein YsdA (DUF1294 family)